ncbi:NusG domain II-containing protein [uncultured Fusobacterium sp.]|uniref:NusG domain II-containing protein n=1 Tax=uncultured Fusobacterium sp. TaxID=159267 RepID=UPI0025D61AEB|nr:NusG domain II-containing protein [uncultured Fusobacterium sp.]MCF2640549.1 NusG domain II-containing protein [Fusobacterium varium]
MRRKRKYFKIGDLIIYSFFIIFFTGLGLKIMNLSQERASKVEIYVDSELKYVYPLQKEERDIFVDTNIGGVNVKFKDNMVRVTSSNSPLKLNVKQGWIKDPGEVIIGVPDRLLIKIVGNKGDNTDSDDIDFIVR